MDRGGQIAFRYMADNGRMVLKEHPFEGILPNLGAACAETDAVAVREAVEVPRHPPCPRLPRHPPAQRARHVLVGGRALLVGQMPLGECRTFFATLQLAGARAQVARRIVREIADRLGFPDRRGPRLPLARPLRRHPLGRRSAAHPPGGQIGSGLTGVMYVLDGALDRPAPARQRPPAGPLARLRDLGNTVIVVEHDEDAMRSADYLVDMGPGAGEHGGEVVAHGTPDRSSPRRVRSRATTSPAGAASRSRRSARAPDPGASCASSAHAATT